MANSVNREPVTHPAGAHDCLLYRDRRQKIALVLQSTELALRRSERCLLVLLREDAAEVREGLAGAGVDVARICRSGRLLFWPPEDHPAFSTPHGLAEAVTRELASEDGGRSTLIVLDGNIWFQSLAHEEGLDEVATSATVRLLCMYHLTCRIPALKFVHLLQSHRHTVFGEHSAAQSPLPLWNAAAEVEYLNEACDLLLQNENEAVFLTDPDGRLILLNEGASALFGIASHEASKYHLRELLPEREAAQMAEREHEALASGEPLTFRLDYRRDDRDRSWLVTTGGPHGSGTQEGYTFWIVRDVTELKRTHKKLRLTAHLMNLIGQAVVATDRRGTIIFWNRAAEELYGWSTVEVLGRDVVEVTGCRIWKERSTDIMNTLTEGQSCSGEFVVAGRDGKELVVHVTQSPIRGDDDRLIGTIGISFDITDRKKAEEALAASEERFRRYFELGLIGMTVAAPDKRIIEANDKACEILGYPREELLHMSWAELTHPEDLAMSNANYERMLAGKVDSYTVEKRYIRKDGEAIDTVISVSCLRRKDGSVESVLALLQDITGRKRAEREIAAYQQRLRLMAEEMYRMEEEERKHLAMVLHDQIGQNLALSKMKLESLQSWERRDELRQEIAQITTLLDEVIDKTRSLTSELRPPVLHELGLQAAVESLCEEFQAQTGIRISYRDDGSNVPLPDPLRTLLFHGVRELLVNVMKHAKATSASVSISSDEGRIMVAVADDGVGFEPSKRKHKESFGLFSLSERLHHFGGGVAIVSVPGEGTRIEMVAPVERPEEGGALH